MIGQHPNDIPGILTRGEIWSRISIGLLLGVSLAVAKSGMERGEGLSALSSKIGIPRMKELIRIAHGQGWRVERLGASTHYKFVPFDKKMPIVTVADSGDPRATRNAISQLRRSGLRLG